MLPPSTVPRAFFLRASCCGNRAAWKAKISYNYPSYNLLHVPEILTVFWALVNTNQIRLPSDGTAWSRSKSSSGP